MKKLTVREAEKVFRNELGNENLMAVCRWYDTEAFDRMTYSGRKKYYP
jgi:hypothetical protein